MDNDLLRSKYISELANSLYSWLPGSAPPFGKTYTFQDVANEYRLVWNEGSKLPALQSLLEQAERKATLVNVVLRIIKEGIKYRDRKNNPVEADGSRNYKFDFAQTWIQNSRSAR